jgi:hypothetical protein
VTEAIQRIHLFCDGNYLYFSARGAGLHQDFAKLESNVIDKFGGPGCAVIESRFFYTRPPAETDPHAVVGWLKAHQWKVVTYSYAHTTQDTLYVSMIHDMWSVFCAEPPDTLSCFVVISGSGALVYPLMSFPKAIIVACVEASANKRLLDLPAVVHIPLVSLLT